MTEVLKFADRIRAAGGDVSQLVPVLEKLDQMVQDATANRVEACGWDDFGSKFLEGPQGFDAKMATIGGNRQTLTDNSGRASDRVYEAAQASVNDEDTSEGEMDTIKGSIPA